MTLCARSQVALFASVFFSCVSFSVVLPTLWPYLSSLHAGTFYLALVVAIYSAGEAAGGLLFGAFAPSGRSGVSLALATGVGLLGSLLYVGAQGVGRGGAHLVLVGRLLQGVWTGAVQALQQVYLADTLRQRDLSVVTVTMSGFANLGFVFGPMFALLASLVPPFPTGPRLRFDELTAPGYFVLLSGLLNVALYLFVLDEPRDRAAAAAAAAADDEAESDVDACGNEDEEQPLLHAAAPPEPKSSFLPALIICNVVCFTHFLGFAIQETATTPLVQGLFDWPVLSADELFTAAAVTSLLGVISLAFATRVVSDRVLTALTLILSVCGVLLQALATVGEGSAALFVGGFLMSMLAFPTGRAAVLSLYTKILPNRLQGIGQGVFLAAGALARVVGPFWAVLAVRGSAPFVFGATGAGFVACLVVMGVWFRQLRTDDPRGERTDRRGGVLK